MKIIDTESNGDTVCINKDIYPTITFTCEETYAKIIVLALQKDTESWLAPIPSECERGNVNPLRYDIDPVQIGDTIIPQTTESLASSIVHNLATSTVSGYTVGSVSTGWTAVNTWANSDLIGRVFQHIKHYLMPPWPMGHGSVNTCIFLNSFVKSYVD